MKVWVATVYAQNDPSAWEVFVAKRRRKLTTKLYSYVHGLVQDFPIALKRKHQKAEVDTFFSNDAWKRKLTIAKVKL